jgi:nitroreductase
MWCSHPGRRVTASSLPCSTRLGAGRPTFRLCPKNFQHYRRELGAQVYGAMGIPITDTAGHRAAVLRNWEFFRAPLAGIVCMHRDLGPVDAVSVGMFLQTLLLALTERGLGSVVEVSVTGYPEIIRAQLPIPAELSILCGLAVGYPDPEFPANRIHIARERVKEHVVFLDN